MLIALALVAGCKTDSDSQDAQLEPIEQENDLGVIRPDEPTVMEITITKPFVPAGVAELVAGSTVGPFAPAPGALPVIAPSGVLFSFEVVVAPPIIVGGDPTILNGEMTLRFTREDGQFVQDVVLELQAEVEEPDITLVTEELDFESVALGEVIARSITIQNPNLATPIEVTNVAPPQGQFSLNPQGNFFPLIIPPQESRGISILFEPTILGDAASGITMFHDVDPLPLFTPIEGTGIVGETILIDGFDFPVSDRGDGVLTTGKIFVDVPAEAVGLSICVQDPAIGDVECRFAGFEVGDPDNEVIFTEDFFGPWEWFFTEPWLSFLGCLTCSLPNSDDGGVQLIPGGGEYCFDFSTTSGSDLNVYISIELRSRGQVSKGRVPLNIHIAPGVMLDEASAPTDNKLRQAIIAADNILAAIGIRIGDIEYVKLGDTDYNTIGDVGTLMDMFFNGAYDGVGAFPSDPSALAIYLVQGFTAPDFLGQNSATLTTPALHWLWDSPFSPLIYDNFHGAAVQFDLLPSDVIGRHMARMIMRQLGVMPTVLDDGTPFGIQDNILDTDPCPPDGSTTEDCPIPGGDYLLFAFDLGPTGIIITQGQRRVALRNTLMFPGLPPVNFEDR